MNKRFICHYCLRVIKGRIDPNIDVFRLANHKAEPRDFVSCNGSGQPVEDEYTGNEHPVRLKITDPMPE